jgi:hypothetical protein
MTAHYEPDPLDAEWDKMPHTLDDYRREIRQLRERCYKYVKELEGLRADLEALSSEMERMERQR